VSRSEPVPAAAGGSKRELHVLLRVVRKSGSVTLPSSAPRGALDMTYLEPIGVRIEAGEPSATGRDVVRVLFKHRWLIIVCFVVVTGVTVGGLAMLPPTYEAEGKVLVQTEQQATPTFFSGLAAYSDRKDFDPASRRLETEMGLIGAAPISA